MVKRLSFFRWLYAALLVAGLAPWADGVSAAGPAPLSSPFFGRWTVSDKSPVFTARGRAYKTIDIGVCGRDFCGVSVDDRGVCGATLFRFLAKHADGKSMLEGHGKWGDAVKIVRVSQYEADDSLLVALGDGYDFGTRDGSMPKFQANYRRAGVAHCFVR